MADRQYPNCSPRCSGPVINRRVRVSLLKISTTAEPRDVVPRGSG